MSTDVSVKTLKINQLTEAQYNTAVQGGVIGANELSFITDANYVETLPSQTGHNGAYLTTNGTDLSWGNLANVAVTGEYNDLANTPVIPAAQVNSDWNANSGVAEILNKPTLSNVATSGDYNDLTNTPTISDLVNTAQLNAINSTITQNLVNTYSEHVADTNIHVTVSDKTTWDNKQDAISTGLVEFNDNPDLMLSAVLVYNDITNITGDAIGLLDQDTIDNDEGDIAAYNTNAYGGAMDSFVPTVRAVADGLNEKQDKLSENNTLLFPNGSLVAYGTAAGLPVAKKIVNTLTNTTGIPTDSAVYLALANKQDTLVSGNNIKTINGNTILGSGDLTVGGSSLPSQSGQSGKFLTTDGTDASWASLANVATTGEYSDLLNTPTIPNVPVVVQDFYVNSTTGAIDCTFSATPTTKTVHTIIGNTVINGTWSGNTFTPNTADDILNNANGFVVSVF